MLVATSKDGGRVKVDVSDAIAFGALFVSSISIIGSGVILTFRTSISIFGQLKNIEAGLKTIEQQNQELRADVNSIDRRLSDLEEIVKLNNPEWFRRKRDGHT